MKKIMLGIIPIYILELNDKIEDVKDNLCYIISANGFFHKKENLLYKSLSKVEKIPGLQEVKEYAILNFPNLPIILIKKVNDFFQEVYNKYKSEAVVLLFYNFELKQWHIEIPMQQVSGASVHYDFKAISIPENFKPVGSIHSHASMGAFHSGIDDKDEYKFDGIHITIGDFDKSEKSYSTRLMVGSIEYKVNIVDILGNDFYDIDNTKWIEKVIENNTSFSYGYYKEHGEYNEYDKFNNDSSNFKKALLFSKDTYKNCKNQNKFKGIFVNKA